MLPKCVYTHIHRSWKVLGATHFPRSDQMIKHHNFLKRNLVGLRTCHHTLLYIILLWVLNKMYLMTKTKNSQENDDFQKLQILDKSWKKVLHSLIDSIFNISKITIQDIRKENAKRSSDEYWWSSHCSFYMIKSNAKNGWSKRRRRLTINEQVWHYNTQTLNCLKWLRWTSKLKGIMRTK